MGGCFVGGWTGEFKKGMNLHRKELIALPRGRRPSYIFIIGREFFFYFFFLHFFISNFLFTVRNLAILFFYFEKILWSEIRELRTIKKRRGGGVLRPLFFIALCRDAKLKEFSLMYKTNCVKKRKKIQQKRKRKISL